MPVSYTHLDVYKRQPYMMADAVQVDADLIAGKEVEKELIIPTTSVDRENVEQYLKDNNITEDAPY